MVMKSAGSLIGQVTHAETVNENVVAELVYLSACVRYCCPPSGGFHFLLLGRIDWAQTVGKFRFWLRVAWRCEWLPPIQLLIAMGHTKICGH